MPDHQSTDQAYEPLRRLPPPAMVDEMRAIEVVWGILEALHPAQRARVLAWVKNVFEGAPHG